MQGICFLINAVFERRKQKAAAEAMQPGIEQGRKSHLPEFLGLNKPMQRFVKNCAALRVLFEFFLRVLFRSFEISWVHYQKSSIMQNINPIMEERSQAICQTIPSPFALLSYYYYPNFLILFEAAAEGKCFLECVFGGVCHKKEIYAGQTLLSSCSTSTCICKLSVLSNY